MKDKPFVLIGVNVDSTVEEMRETEQKLGINWRSFYGGYRGGKIAESWAVKTWPMTFVIDAKGTIRARSDHGGMDVGANFMRFQVEPIVEKLLGEMAED